MLRAVRSLRRVHRVIRLHGDALMTPAVGAATWPGSAGRPLDERARPPAARGRGRSLRGLAVQFKKSVRCHRDAVR